MSWKPRHRTAPEVRSAYLSYLRRAERNETWAKVMVAASAAALVILVCAQWSGS